MVRVCVRCGGSVLFVCRSVHGLWSWRLELDNERGAVMEGTKPARGDRGEEVEVLRWLR